jgi:hypothetical protein
LLRHKESCGMNVARAVAKFALAAILVCVGTTVAFGDAGVVLNESLDTSVARVTGSGHAAVYLSNICADRSPVKMRLCRPGEQGSVLSNYTTLGEDQPYEWNIVPLSVYLYGVEDPRDRPLVSSREIKAALEERYREKYLSTICTGARCRYSNSAEWREMVGATLERSVYFFVVRTSEEQDREVIAEFNSLPNVNHFNGMTRNCADFTRRVMNIYFPHAVRPDYINDFFMTSPKAVARSLTKYAQKNPELAFRVLHFAQVPGTIKRSEECRSGTEQLYHSKKLVVPLGVLAWQAVPAVTAFYIATAHFNPEHQFEGHPSADAIGADYYFVAAGAAGATDNVNQNQNQDAGLDPGATKAEANFAPAPGGFGYTVSVEQLAAEEKAEHEEIVGTNDEWKQYRANLNAAIDEAIHVEIIPDRSYLKRVFVRLGEGGTISVDENGALWMSWPSESIAPVSRDASAVATTRVGLSASNIAATDSDLQTAYQIILARMQAELNSPKHSRETSIEFKQDWTRLQNSRDRATALAASRQDLPLASPLASNSSLLATSAFQAISANSNVLTSKEVSYIKGETDAATPATSNFLAPASRNELR